MTDDEKRQWVADFYDCSTHEVAPREIRRLSDLIARIESETRAAVLAEEDRRVWCERYAHCHELWGREAAQVAADRFLERYREARAAWGARDG